MLYVLKLNNNNIKEYTSPKRQVEWNGARTEELSSSYAKGMSERMSMNAPVSGLILFGIHAEMNYVTGENV